MVGFQCIISIMFVLRLKYTLFYQLWIMHKIFLLNRFVLGCWLGINRMPFTTIVLPISFLAAILLIGRDGHMLFSLQPVLKSCRFLADSEIDQ